MSKEKVLVFGGSGFIGVYLVEELYSRGYKVAIVDLQAPPKLHASIDFHAIDIMNIQAVEAIVKQCNPKVIYNLAGFANLDDAVGAPLQTINLNVVGNTNVLEAARANNVPLFVYASSAYAMSNKGSFYGISKLISEKIVEEYNARFGQNFVILRYGSLYSERNFHNNYLYKIIQMAIQKNQIVHHGDGEEIREYIHAADAARLSVNVIENRQYHNRHIILSGNERMKRKELFQMIKEIIGNSDLQIKLSETPSPNHYQVTPYSFNPTVSQKLLANPHIDIGQGILECVRSIYQCTPGNEHQ
jgi:UDP-glucose 4-epimerase